MRRVFQRHIWRGAVGLIAAYALVFQAFLTYSIASQAAAQGGTAGSFFVFCNSHDSATTADEADAPVKPVTHCPICTLAASGAATLPDPVVLPTRQPSADLLTPFVSVAACIAFHSARAGLSRAPPQTV